MQTDELQAAIAALWADARPRLLVRVDALEREPDLDKALIHAHTLAGTLGSFGLADASAAAREAERAAAAGDRAAVVSAARSLRAALEA